MRNGKLLVGVASSNFTCRAVIGARLARSGAGIGFVLRGSLSFLQSLVSRRGENILAGNAARQLSELFFGTLETSTAAMPLLQDTNRAGGGSNENRRSLADILGLDTLLTDPPVAAPASTRSNDFGDNEWSWEGPGSPEIAQTPLALVPPGCFPPRHPRQYASYSESAQPGGWDELSNGQDITDLVASLKALGMPGPGRPLISYPPPSGTVSRDDGSGDPSWTGSRMNGDASSQEDRMTLLSRRSSFCGPGMSTLYRGPGNGRALRWSGVLPARTEDPNAEYSSKLFLGGTPWDITEEALMHALRHFNPLRVEWPGSSGCPRGFAYVTFESELKVRALLAACRRDRAGWYYKLHTRKCRSKEVEVIPWVVSEANWMSRGSARLAAARTVFVGALHGMLSAPALALIMNDLFSGVVYAGIDTDKHKYPIGSGRVSFDNVHSYVRAISAAYIEIRTDKFTKKVQVDPYLEDSLCSVCNLRQGPYFCREPTCFGYFCRSCWSWQHQTAEHKPLMRNSKSQHPQNGQRNSPPNENGSYYGGYGSSTDGTLTSPSTSGGPGTSGTSGDLEASPGEHDSLWQH